jgi:N6-adenosine-specific RNA methylase IME4
MITFPNKKYHIIYADPPWSYNKRSNKNTKFGGGAMGHYPTMTLDDIKSLPVQKITQENCVLFLWVTFPRLQEGLDVIKAWGFTYKTLGFSWHKLNKDNSLFFGIGSYTKSNCEVCLFATKGKVGITKKGQPFTDPKEKLSVRSNKVSSAINSQRQRHSKKPHEIRNRIRQLFGDVSRIELFARQSATGWDHWGNEKL